MSDFLQTTNGSDPGDDSSMDIEREIAESVAQVNASPDFADPLGATASFEAPPPVFGQRRKPVHRVVRSAGAPRAFQTLADLYATHPVGDDGGELIIERVKPKNVRGQRAAGYLSKSSTPLSVEEIRERWGGGVYRVKVVGASENSDRAITLGTMENLEIAGEAKLGSFRDLNGDRMPYADHLNTPSVAMKKMDLDYKERQDLQARYDRAQQRLLEVQEEQRRHEPDTLRLLHDAGEKRVQEVRSQQAQIIEVLSRDQDRLTELNEDLRRQLEEQRREYETRVRRLEQENYETRAESLRRFEEQESHKVQEIKRMSEERLTILKEEHARRLQEVQSHHTNQLAEATARWERERSDLIHSHERTLERLSREQERSERSMKESADSREKTLRETYERRLQEQERQQEREMRSLRDSFEMQRTSLQIQADSTKAISRESAQMQINMLQNSLAQAQAQVDRLQTENGDLRAKVFKAPLEAINEAQDLVGQLGLGGNKEERSDWKDTFAQVMRGAIDKLPDVANAISQQREQNHAAQMQVERQRALRQEREVRAAHRRQLQAQQQNHDQQQQIQQAQQQQQAPAPTDLGSPPGAPEPPKTTLPYNSEGQEGHNATAASGINSFVSPPEGEPMGSILGKWEEPPQPPQPPQPTQPPQAGDSPELQALANRLASQPLVPDEGSGDDATTQAFIRLAQELDTAIRGGVISPGVFFGALQKEVPEETLQQVVYGVTADDFVDTLEEQLDQEAAITSYKGRKYLQELWTVAQQHIPAPAAPAEPLPVQASPENTGT